MKPNLASIVTLVAQERVADARALLNTELSERVLGALSDAKQELASNLFKSPELQEETETEKKNLVEENGYVAFYKGQRHEVHANTIYDAQKKAAAHFKAKKVWEVNIKLAEKDGKQVTHLPLDEAEQLDELSKSTLKSYIKKAGKDAADHASASQMHYSAAKHYQRHPKEGYAKKSFNKSAEEDKKATKRFRGIDKAVSKLEESEELDEMMTRKHFQMVADTIKSHPDQQKRNELAHHHSEIFRRENPRFDHKRFYAAANAQLKEETLSELKSSTLKNYISKSVWDVQHHGHAAGELDAKGKKSLGTAHSKKAYKRLAGVRTAATKLARRAPDKIKFKDIDD